MNSGRRSILYIQLILLFNNRALVTRGKGEISCSQETISSEATAAIADARCVFTARDLRTPLYEFSVKVDRTEVLFPTFITDN